jgi:hypothetical protein
MKGEEIWPRKTGWGSGYRSYYSDYIMGWTVSDSDGRQKQGIFLHSKTNTPALGTTEPPVDTGGFPVDTAAGA